MLSAPGTWHDVADVVIVGSGGGALTGALVAALEGLSVVVLEKTSLVGGTTSVSGGGFWIPVNHHMAEVGVEDSREEALAYLRACAGESGDDSHLVALVDRGAEMVRYLEDRGGLAFRPWPAVGGTIDYRPWLPGAKHGGRTLVSGRFEAADLGEWAAKVRVGMASSWTMDPLDYYRHRMHALPPDPALPRRQTDVRPGEVEAFASGSALVAQLLRACLAHGVDIRLESPADELVLADGRVVGVAAEHDGEHLRVQARRGVLVATGGYANNEELKRLWMQRPLELTCDIVENQGDGHLMGIAVGAQVANLGDAWWMPHIHLGDDGAGPVNIGMTREDRILPHTIMVNAAGKRFVNEALNYYDVCEAFGAKVGASPRNLPAWLLFDTQGVERYSALAYRVPAGDPPPWLVVADTVAELAERLGIDPVALAETVERFNVFAREGADLDFGRGESAWDVAWGDPDNGPNPSLGTLEKAPFYALEVRSGALSTKGGLRVDDRGRVVSAKPPFGTIPGLYAAGNCSNGGVAGAYPGAGATIGAAMTFAYLAALDMSDGRP